MQAGCDGASGQCAASTSRRDNMCHLRGAANTTANTGQPKPVQALNLNLTQQAGQQGEPNNKEHAPP